jgi:hypothetical protein
LAGGSGGGAMSNGGTGGAGGASGDVNPASGKVTRIHGTSLAWK